MNCKARSKNFEISAKRSLLDVERHEVARVSRVDGRYLLILDTNVWVTERMLQSSLGSAVLYALASDGASIVLPEVVEMEVELVLRRQAEKAAEELRKNVDFLRQISGHKKGFHAIPTSKAIDDGIARRWKELEGVIIRAPFTIQQARSSLCRILNHLSPSGENNEQFRDCCIWASTLEFSASQVVHLVTNDTAFYSGRDRRNMALPLQSDLEACARTVKLHSSVGGFLEMVSHGSIDILEKEVICDEIVKSATPLAYEIAAGRANSRRSQKYEIFKAERITIKGYATPKPSLVAVAFEVSFDLSKIDREVSEERQIDTILTLDGSCSYDPARKEASDMVIISWSHNVKSGNGSFWGKSSPDQAFVDQLSQTRYI